MAYPRGRVRPVAVGAHLPVHPVEGELYPFEGTELNDDSVRTITAGAYGAVFQCPDMNGWTLYGDGTSNIKYEKTHQTDYAPASEVAAAVRITVGVPEHVNIGVSYGPVTAVEPRKDSWTVPPDGRISMVSGDPYGSGALAGVVSIPDESVVYVIYKRETDRQWRVVYEYPVANVSPLDGDGFPTHSNVPRIAMDGPDSCMVGYRIGAATEASEAEVHYLQDLNGVTTSSLVDSSLSSKGIFLANYGDGYIVMSMNETPATQRTFRSTKQGTKLGSFTAGSAFAEGSYLNSCVASQIDNYGLLVPVLYDGDTNPSINLIASADIVQTNSSATFQTSGSHTTNMGENPYFYCITDTPSNISTSAQSPKNTIIGNSLSTHMNPSALYPIKVTGDRMLCMPRRIYTPDDRNYDTGYYSDSWLRWLGKSCRKLSGSVYGRE